MSYTKQTWQTGDKITADKLNHMEDGIDKLNNDYDIIFHVTDGVGLQNALGISPEELFGKEFSSLNSMMVFDSTDVQNVRMYIRETYHELTANDTFINFYFTATEKSVGISYNGTFEYDDKAGTYTYSDGMYTFTVNDESPK